MSVTREHFHPQYQRELDEREVMREPGRDRQRAEDVSVKREPRRARQVTYPTPDGPAFVGTTVIAPYGEDPTDITTQAVPRRQTIGMIGRFHEQKRKAS